MRLDESLSLKAWRKYASNRSAVAPDLSRLYLSASGEIHLRCSNEQPKPKPAEEPKPKPC